MGERPGVWPSAKGSGTTCVPYTQTRVTHIHKHALAFGEAVAAPGPQSRMQAGHTCGAGISELFMLSRPKISELSIKSSPAGACAAGFGLIAGRSCRRRGRRGAWPGGTRSMGERQADVTGQAGST
jgi:hypothetical protein